MRIAGNNVVVTGAAAGIGQAMARRFAAEGANGVVVADLDLEGAARVAEEIGPRAIAVACDVSSAEANDELIDRAEDAFGPVDLFCANAGIGVGGELDAAPELWRLSFDVNVLSHVHAARRLVPGWVERGAGHFLSTASAAGLLSAIGAAPYAVTKSATIAFAEWLSITYGDRGVAVSCLCPMGVRTKLLEDGLASGGAAGLGLLLSNSAGRIIEAEEVADVVVEGLRDERFMILPHPQVEQFVQVKCTDRERWMTGMRRLQSEQLTMLAASDV